VGAGEEAGGVMEGVSGREILQGYRLRARQEGVFAGPASAASVAGLLMCAADGRLPRGQRVVCTLTGNGLKDPDWAIAGAPQPVTVPVDASAAAAALELS